MSGFCRWGKRFMIRHSNVVGLLAALGTYLLKDPALISGALTGSLGTCHIISPFGQGSKFARYI